MTNEQKTNLESLVKRIGDAIFDSFKGPSMYQELDSEFARLDYLGDSYGSSLPVYVASYERRSAEEKESAGLKQVA